jgi:hypothetical protein
MREAGLSVVRVGAALALLGLAACMPRLAEDTTRAELPKSVSVIKVERVAPVSGLIQVKANDPEAALIPVPSQDQVNMLAPIRAGIAEEFDRAGIRLVDSGSTHDARLRLYYLFERSPVFNSYQIRALLYLYDNNGKFISIHNQVYATQSLMEAMVYEADKRAFEVGQGVARKTIQQLKQALPAAEPP